MVLGRGSKTSPDDLEASSPGTRPRRKVIVRSAQQDGTLRITVLRGRNLVAADRNGLSDPYVLLKVRGTTSRGAWKSRVEKRTLDPVWNQTASFQGQLGKLIQRPVRLLVVDKDSIFRLEGKDDPLGHVHVPVSQLLTRDTIVATDVPLEGVAHGTVSFTATFEEHPQRGAFPAMPLHASALLVLRLEPPDDASAYERFRDRALISLTHRAYKYIAAAWVLSLCGWGLFVALLFGDYAVLSITNSTGPSPMMAISPTQAESWINVCLQVMTGLFSYLNLLTCPWRVAIAVHHWDGRRSSAPGLDFYGRPTDALFFWTPSGARSAICALLLLSVGFHFATQVAHHINNP